MSACGCDCHNQPVTQALLDRFWRKVDKAGQCWIWKGAVKRSGYGQFQDENRRLVAAHRFAYKASVGPIPEGKVVDHICRSRACVNPAHLRIVTPGENVQNQDGHKDSLSGYRGVSWHKSSGKWRAAATVAGTYYHGGYYDAIEEAAEAARQLRNEVMTHNSLDRMATK